MNTQNYHPLLHRLAVITMVLAFLPIIVGALVTTLDAGMAFRDWPSSDGHNLFFYPWLKSAGDKFIEHGHRLAGALIGFVSIGLAFVAWKLETNKTVRRACYAVLLAVIVQGLLGGGRVRLDARTLAMIHGSFAALVFGLMASVSLITSRGWIEFDRTHTSNATVSPALSILTWAVCGAIFLQYLMGGLVRHLGLALYEHLAGAVLVLIMVIATTIVSQRSQVPLLQKAGWWVFAFLLLQFSLGLGTWVMKFGFTPTGYVALAGSAPQVFLRTAHTVGGMLLLASAILLKLKTLRCQAVGIRTAASLPNLPDATLTWDGGLR